VDSLRKRVELAILFECRSNHVKFLEECVCVCSPHVKKDTRVIWTVIADTLRRAYARAEVIIPIRRADMNM
jgi:hypothetical protein